MTVSLVKAPEVWVITRRWHWEECEDNDSVDMEDSVEIERIKVPPVDPIEWVSETFGSMRIIRESSAVQAAKIIQSEYLTFAATGGSWAADPDGSRDDYSAGGYVERSAHLHGFSDRDERAVVRMVG